MKVHADTRVLTRPLPGGSAGTTVTVEPILTGTLSAARSGLESAPHFKRLRMLGIGAEKLTLPVPAYLVRHPGAGAFLIDTGLHASVAARPAENLGRIVTRAMHPHVEPGEDLPAQLRARGVDPKAIRLVVMTHLHVDHASGMSEFPTAAFVISEAEWKSATTESRPLLNGYRHAHYDYAFDYRTISYDSELISSYATFGRTFDLFGDGSVRLASTPGHSAGHQSVICRLAERDLVIAGDAIYTMAQLDGAPEPPRPYDDHNWRRSMRELQHFARTYPQAIIFAGHDPDQLGLFGKRYE